MISTLYFIILLAFQLWYLTSGKVKQVHPAGYILHLKRHPQRYRLAGGVLLLLVTALFVVKLGWMSGVSASLIGLMGVGSLVIVLAPFHYLRGQAVFIIYIFFLFLELFI